MPAAIATDHHPAERPVLAISHGRAVIRDDCNSPIINTGPELVTTLELKKITIATDSLLRMIVIANRVYRKSQRRGSQDDRSTQQANHRQFLYLDQRVL
jgi:hypothetical protein